MARYISGVVKKLSPKDYDDRVQLIRLIVNGDAQLYLESMSHMGYTLAGDLSRWSQSTSHQRGGLYIEYIHL